MEKFTYPVTRERKKVILNVPGVYELSGLQRGYQLFFIKNIQYTQSEKRISKC